jgi:hypothetical protein
VLSHSSSDHHVLIWRDFAQHCHVAKSLFDFSFCLPESLAPSAFNCSASFFTVMPFNILRPKSVCCASSQNPERSEGTLCASDHAQATTPQLGQNLGDKQSQQGLVFAIEIYLAIFSFLSPHYITRVACVSHDSLIRAAFGELTRKSPSRHASFSRKCAMIIGYGDHYS